MIVGVCYVWLQNNFFQNIGLSFVKELFCPQISTAVIVLQELEWEGTSASSL